MAVNALGWVYKEVEGGAFESLSPGEVLILFIVAGFSDERRKSWPTQQRIAKISHMSPRAVSSALQNLQEAGLIKTTKAKNPDGLVTNIYELVAVPEEIAAADTMDVSTVLRQLKGRAPAPQEPAPLLEDDRLVGLDIPRWLPKSELLKVPEWVPLETWIEFEQARKQMRKPVTKAARKRLIGELENMEAEHGPQYAVMAIEQSILKGWTSFYPLNEEFRKRLQQNSSKIIIRDSKKNRGIVYQVKVRIHADGSEEILDVVGKRKMTPEELEEFDRKQREREAELAREQGWDPN